jgi:hypothetical protein
MKRLQFVLAAPLAGLAAPAAGLAPPVPAPAPPGLEQPIDGYDMQLVFQIWRRWVESEKGPVSEALLDKPDSIEGLKPFAIVLRFARSNDFGYFMTGEIRSYCRPQANGYLPERGTCHYQLRRAYVPHEASSHGGANPVADWTRTRFDPRALVRHFRTVGLGPDTDWWRADPKKMFAASPSPRDMLAANATIVRLGSRECPGMADAIEALEGKALGKADVPTIGEDAEIGPPAPHAVTTTITLNLRSGGGTLQLKGWRGLVEQMVSPILDAADFCETLRKP